MAKKDPENKPESQDKENLREDLLNRFLVNQSKELENESKMIDFRKKNDEFGHTYAMEALKRQSEDRAETRTQRTLFMKYGFWLTIVAFLLFASFIGTCFYTGNVDLVYTFGKWVLIILPVLTSGYFIGLNRGKKSENNSEAQEVEE